jgi:pyridinium-3,5-biscarboxylic acid mononucleotide synthase
MADHEITLDFQRAGRIGFEEAIFSQGKTPEQLNEILNRARAHGAALLLTRLSPLQLEGVAAEHKSLIDYEPVSRTAFYGPLRPEAPSRIAIVAAGTSDAHVFREIARTARYYGHGSTQFIDVGVAGIWRLLEKVELIKQHPVVIVVAGMDAALPTVVGGLVGSVVIGVPTSNGYGVAAGGQPALNAILSSCAPGVTVLNIDNGYGAACAAIRVLHAIDRAAGAAR